MFSVTKNGKKLDKNLYTWDEESKTFSTKEDRLVLDFSEYNGVTFKTSYGCTFKTGHGCTFDTGSGCTFDTGSSCTFDTGSDCTFDTGPYCTFKTGSGCTFKTVYDCTFDTGSSCTFKTEEDCVIVRRDVFEIIQPEPNVKIRLNGWGEKGYTLVKDTKTITIDGKDIEISLESFESLKEQLTNN